MAATRRRKTIYGNDLYRELTTPGKGQPFRVTYWDLWIGLVLDAQFGGNWDELIDHFRAKRKEHYHRDEVEGLLNHVRLLRQALALEGMTIADLLTGADPAFLKTQVRKARRKILEMGFRNREKSTWMIDTPRKQREERAMRGYWNHFPVSPDAYAGPLEGQYKTSGYYSERQSWDLERTLSRFLEKHEQDASLPQLFALYRAFLTVVVEQMGLVDDSFGVIGQLCGQVFDGYVGLDWREIELPPALFFQDLIEFIIWEDYAFTWKRDRVFLAGLDSEQVPLVESIVRSQWEELAALELEYPAEKALNLLGMLYTEQRMFDRFVPLAKQMGSRAWERITTMAEMAERHGRHDLALAVYEACLEPGMHEGFLRKRYKQLRDRQGTRTQTTGALPKESKPPKE
jgi:hypothetical protein